jgi:hypothetical protein
MLQIGLTSASLITVTNPDGGQALLNSIIVKRTLDETVTNTRIVTHTGTLKKDYTFNFVNKSIASFNLINTFCNVPQFYLVRFTINSTLIIDSFYYLEMLEVQESLISNNLLKNFTINLIQR